MPNQPLESTPTPPPTRIWLGLAEQVPTPRGTVRIRFLWFRIVLLSLALVVVGWLSVGAVIFFIYRQLGYESVSYVDSLLVPVRRAEIRRQQGDFQIEQAKGYLEKKEYREALEALRYGTVRSPANLEGRMLLARVLSSWRPEEAVAVLEEGLAHATKEDEDYLRFYVQVMLTQRHDESVLRLADKMLPPTPEITRVNAMLALAAAQAAINQGQYDRARQLADDYKLVGLIDGALVFSAMYEQLGRAEASLGLLRGFARQYSNSPEIDPILREMGRLLLKADQAEAAIQVSVARALRDSAGYSPKVSLIEAYHAAGREERVTAEVEGYLRQFRTNAEALYALTDAAVGMKDVRTARRLYETALENNIDLAPFCLLMIETYLATGRHQEALDFCAELEAEAPSWLEAYEPFFNGLRTVAYFALGDAVMAQSNLDRLLESGTVDVLVLQGVADRLSQVGQADAAHRLLREALRRDERNPLTLMELVKLDLRLGQSKALAEHARALMDLRQPGFEILEGIQQGLASDRFLFTPNRDGLASRVASSLDAMARFEWTPSLESPREILIPQKPAEEAAAAVSKPAEKTGA